MPILTLGTRNRKKCLELNELLAGCGWEVADLSARPELPEPAETAGTFIGNASLKAAGYAKAIGGWVLTDDSGLVVPALNGEPGVDSALYAGVHGDDAANNTKLLQRLDGLPESARAGYYICVTALANPAGEIVATSEGRCNGIILREPRGPGNFGYDPLFCVPEFHRTFGELSLRVKGAISHRARAVTAMRPALHRFALTA